MAPACKGLKGGVGVAFYGSYVRSSWEEKYKDLAPGEGGHVRACLIAVPSFATSGHHPNITVLSPPEDVWLAWPCVFRRDAVLGGK